MPNQKHLLRFCFCGILFLFSDCRVKQNDTTPLLPLKDLNPNIAVGSPIEISFNNDKYYNTIKSEFNTGQGLWYARSCWQSKTSYKFSELNENINWMAQFGLKPTVHMLVGQDRYMPDWLINGNWKKTDLENMLRDMIYKIMDTNDNKNKVDSWNVINELFEDDGSYRTNMVWNKLGWEADSSGLSGDDKINKIHPVFIRKAFTFCREKTTKNLELREFNIESNNPSTPLNKKHKAFYQLVKHMLNVHIPIDAVGIQGHLYVGQSGWRFEKNALKNTVQKLKELGIEVYITELDASLETSVWSKTSAQKQKDDYYNYVKQAIEGGASRIYLWGIQDGMDKGWLTYEHPLLWDSALNKKPAYYGFSKALYDTK